MKRIKIAESFSFEEGGITYTNMDTYLAMFERLSPEWVHNQTQWLNAENEYNRRKLETEAAGVDEDDVLDEPALRERVKLAARAMRAYTSALRALKRVGATQQVLAPVQSDADAARKALNAASYALYKFTGANSSSTERMVLKAMRAYPEEAEKIIAWAQTRAKTNAKS